MSPLKTDNWTLIFKMNLIKWLYNNGKNVLILNGWQNSPASCDDAKDCLLESVIRLYRTGMFRVVFCTPGGDWGPNKNKLVSTLLLLTNKDKS